MGKRFFVEKVHMCERRGFALVLAAEHARVHVRALVLALALVLVLSLCACGKTETGKNNGGSSGKETVQGTTAQGGNDATGGSQGNSLDATGGSQDSSHGNGGSNATDSGNGSGGGNGGTADASNEKAHSMQVIIYSRTKADFIIENAWVVAKGTDTMLGVNFSTRSGDYRIQLDGFGEDGYLCGFSEGVRMICLRRNVTMRVNA